MKGAGRAAVGRGEGCGGVLGLEGRAGTLALLAGVKVWAGSWKRATGEEGSRRAGDRWGSGEERAEGGDLGFLQPPI